MAEYLKRNRTTGGCPVDHEALKSKEGGGGGGCPVLHDDIDPTNMMPKIPKQLPHPDQDFELPTDRVASTIPKGKEDADTGTWVFPSPQMFYNAVKRKGGDADLEAMETVVSVHNRVNEYCWKQIEQWEAQHGDHQPKLVSFKGRYKDLSPKARFFMALGYERPFDRHDWVIDRKGEKVRYVIDYYEAGKENESLGDGIDVDLDIRPALDSFGAFWDRTRMLFKS